MPQGRFAPSAVLSIFLPQAELSLCLSLCCLLEDHIFPQSKTSPLAHVHVGPEPQQRHERPEVPGICDPTENPPHLHACVLARGVAFPVIPPETTRHCLYLLRCGDEAAKVQLQ